MRSFRPGKLFPPKNNKYDLIEQAWDQYSFHDLEIGAGVGMHPIEWARQNSKHLVVAVERTSEKFLKFDKSDRSENLFPVHADITSWLWFFEKDKKFDSIWILYPNPEPKNKNQRWVNQPFFHHIVGRLKPKGQIILATNIQTYYAEAAQQLKTEWNMKVQGEVYKGPYRTHFEKKYLERNEVCYNIVATLNEA